MKMGIVANILAAAVVVGTSPQLFANGFETKEAALAAAGINLKIYEENADFSIRVSESYDHLKSELGDAFSGTWIEYDEDGSAYQVIAINGPVNVAKFAVEKNRVVVYSYGNSLSYLEGVKNSIIKNYMSHAVSDKSEVIVQSVSIDEIENIVSVKVYEDNYNSILDLFENDGIDTSVVVVDMVDDDFEFRAGVYAGMPFLYSGPGQNYGLCSTAFVGTIDIYPDSYPVMLTAGHCANNLARQNVYFGNISFNNISVGSFIGSFFRNDFGLGRDSAFIGKSNSADWLSGGVYRPGYPQEAVKSPVHVTPAMVNSYACTSGTSSGWRCGTIAKSSVFEYLNGYGNGYTGNMLPFDLAELRVCGRPGDSGGSVLTASGNALGIYIGGRTTAIQVDGNCSGGAVVGGTAVGSTTAISLFQPIMPVVINHSFNIRTYSP